MGDEANNEWDRPRRRQRVSMEEDDYNHRPAPRENARRDRGPSRSPPPLSSSSRRPRDSARDDRSYDADPKKRTRYFKADEEDRGWNRQRGSNTKQNSSNHQRSPSPPGRDRGHPPPITSTTDNHYQFSRSDSGWGSRAQPAKDSDDRTFSSHIRPHSPQRPPQQQQQLYQSSSQNDNDRYRNRQRNAPPARKGQSPKGSENGRSTRNHEDNSFDNGRFGGPDHHRDSGYRNNREGGEGANGAEDDRWTRDRYGRNDDGGSKRPQEHDDYQSSRAVDSHANNNSVRNPYHSEEPRRNDRNFQKGKPQGHRRTRDEPPGRQNQYSNRHYGQQDNQQHYSQKKKHQNKRGNHKQRFQMPNDDVDRRDRGNGYQRNQSGFHDQKAPRRDARPQRRAASVSRSPSRSSRSRSRSPPRSRSSSRSPVSRTRRSRSPFMSPRPQRSGRSLSPPPVPSSSRGQDSRPQNDRFTNDRKDSRLYNDTSRGRSPLSSPNRFPRKPYTGGARDRERAANDDVDRVTRKVLSPSSRSRSRSASPPRGRRWPSKDRSPSPARRSPYRDRNRQPPKRIVESNRFPPSQGTTFLGHKRKERSPTVSRSRSRSRSRSVSRSNPSPRHSIQSLDCSPEREVRRGGAGGKPGPHRLPPSGPRPSDFFHAEITSFSTKFAPPFQGGRNRFSPVAPRAPKGMQNLPPPAQDNAEPAHYGSPYRMPSHLEPPPEASTSGSLTQTNTSFDHTTPLPPPSLKNLPNGPRVISHSTPNAVGLRSVASASVKKFFGGTDEDEDPKKPSQGSGRSSALESRGATPTRADARGFMPATRPVEPTMIVDSVAARCDAPSPSRRQFEDDLLLEKGVPTNSSKASHPRDSRGHNNLRPLPSSPVRSPKPLDHPRLAMSQNGQSFQPESPRNRPAMPPPISAPLANDPPPVQRQPRSNVEELYHLVNQVGEGTFGKVYKARNNVTGALVALKRIKVEGERDGFPVTAMREIKLLQSLRHENIIDLHEMMVSKGNVYMVFEYMEHDLTGILSQTQFSFTPAHLKSLCRQMLAGLSYLHQKGVIHRDMKGSNILVNSRGELKLADFGLARFYMKRRQSDYTNRVITLWYRPPELLLGATLYGPEVDIWSTGAIMLELFTKKPVFQGNDEIHQLEVIYRVMGTPDTSSWPGLTSMPWYELVKPTEGIRNHFRDLFAKYMTPAALDLAESLLAYDPSTRCTAAEALRAPYFTSEQPPEEQPFGLSSVEGEWHELETKREKEKARKRRKTEGIPSFSNPAVTQSAAPYGSPPGTAAASKPHYPSLP